MRPGSKFPGFSIKLACSGIFSKILCRFHKSEPKQTTNSIYIVLTMDLMLFVSCLFAPGNSVYSTEQPFYSLKACPGANDSLYHLSGHSIRRIMMLICSMGGTTHFAAAWVHRHLLKAHATLLLVCHPPVSVFSPY